jgi:xanthine dehydrogenase accessory factor
MDYLEQMVMLRKKGEPFVLATVVRIEKPTSAKPGAKAIITQDGALNGWVGGSCTEPSVKKEAVKALQEGTPRLLRLCPPEKMSDQEQYGVSEMKITCMSGGTLEIYLEPYLVQPHLLVIGHQALAEALVTQAKSLDYAVTVVTENPAPGQFFQADRVITGLDFTKVDYYPNTYAVIASHGNYDELALEAVLQSKAAYVALVASKKRSESILAYLQQDQVPQEQIDRIKYPAGLDIGAMTPPEIALSILAEIIQVHRRGHGNGNPVHVNETIHEDEESQKKEEEEAIDPVCGMTVEIGSTSLSATYQGKVYYFCSAGCQRKFTAQPEKYIQPDMAHTS